jgi:Meiotically Up-regulated Gene 113 (MUG113) protein/helix-turn-helix protein
MAVYFIQDGHGHIKIGYSRDPMRRLRALQAGRSDEIRLLRVVNGDQSVERCFHRHFVAHRIRGEWFTFHADMLTVVAPEEQVLVEGQPMTETQFLVYLARAVKTAGTQRELAKQLGISQAYLSQILRRERKASSRLLTALGLKRRPLEIDAA